MIELFKDKSKGGFEIVSVEFFEFGKILFDKSGEVGVVRVF